MLEHIFVKQVTFLVQLSVIVYLYVKSARINTFLIIESTMSIFFLVLGHFEKRERPTVTTDGYRDAIIDCLYKNTNTRNVLS